MRLYLMLSAQVEALFITHLHGDHCFGIGTMLVAMCKARKAAAAAADGTTTSSSSSNELAGPDDASALRVFGPPRVGELIASMLYIAGVGRQLDQPLYITEFVETER
jgi:ribonuclease BN (tRNA processing enzyme)